MVRTSVALRTIAAAVDSLGLPPPREYRITGTSIWLGFRSPAHVDVWARHIGLPPAAAATRSGVYTAIDFWAPGSVGWCGAEMVSLTAPIAHPAVTA